MERNDTRRRLRIPVKFVDGLWEFALGGIVPVAPDSSAELIIDRSRIADKGFLKRLTGKSRHKVLDQGTQLLVCLTVKDEPKILVEAARHLIPYETLKSSIATAHLERWSPETLRFVAVTIGTPSPEQTRSLGSDQGGLWLLAEGITPIGLMSTRIVLPYLISPTSVVSLNHAFTKLSEVYEPWRISHTGNIYTRVLYQERNGKWYPLDGLRNAALDKTEQAIARALWIDFMKKFSSSEPFQAGE